MKKFAILSYLLLMLLSVITTNGQNCSTVYGAGYNGPGSSLGIQSYDYTTNTWDGVSLESTGYFTAPNTIKNGGPIAIDPLNQNINFITDASNPNVAALFTFGSAPVFVNFPANITGLSAQILCSGYKPASHVCYYMTQNFLSNSPTPAGTAFFSIDFTNPVAPIGKIYNSALAQGSPTINTNSGGDLCFDGNGTGYLVTSSKQLYTFVTDEVAQTATFTYITSLSGLTFAPTAIAFDPNTPFSLTITGATTAYTNYSLPNNTLNVLTPNAGWIAPDLASCVFPNINPAITVTKTLYDVTQSAAPPVTVYSGDIIQYTITATNTGNANAGGFIMADTLPAGVSYVPGSTTMNGAAVADGTGSSFPLFASIVANSSDQTAGSGILTTNSTSGSPTCVIQYNVKVTGTIGSTITNTANASATGSSPTTPITAQGSYSFTVGVTTLPVTLVSFTASQQGNEVFLNWETTNEINNNRFEIERNPNSNSFETIGTVMADSNNSLMHNYSFTDPSPVNGINYYRLKQIDLDGKATYSSVQSVNFNDAYNQTIKLYPNPAVKTQTVELSIGQTCQQLVVQIMNSAGQLQSKQTFANTNAPVPIDISSLAKGVYYVIITADEKTLQPQKLIVE